jgi:hypothetical protein
MIIIHDCTFSGNNFEEIKFSFARRYFMAVSKHPKPYFMLRNKFMDEASAKYFVGQLTSATLYPNHKI